jgi:glycosyltransferase involved in cell wall biosynthesis
MNHLHVAMDARSLKGFRTGIGTYCFNLLEHLLSIDSRLRLLLVTDSDLPAHEWMRTDRITVAKKSFLSTNNFLWTNIGIRPLLKHHGVDLLHSPGYTLPLRLEVPSVVTIHDVSYAAHPHWYPYRGGAIRNAWYRASALKADHIITVSEFSRREILRVYDLDPKKVSVIYLGVNRLDFHPIVHSKRMDELKHRYALHDRFVLFVGDMHPRRNVARIIEAMELIRQSGPSLQETQLVLIGRVLDPNLQRLLDKWRRMDAKAIRSIGCAAEEDLPLFYNMAQLFLFPSFYEGFGLGVLEAMSCGCPVIVSKGSACEEIAGEAGICVDPWDCNSIAEAAIRILSDRSLRDRHGQAAIVRSHQFDWLDTARQALTLYTKLVG